MQDALDDRSGDAGADEMTTREVARRLGLAVRSVQLMVDRGELRAWKTPGGHRRIDRGSVERWLHRRSPARPEGGPDAPTSMPPAPPPVPATGAGRTGTAARGAQPRVLLIEDSRHYQNLVALLVRQRFPRAELHVADDGIAGLAMAGRLRPEVLLVDILLPGIDGAALITGLRSHPEFSASRLIVVTSLDPEAMAPYAFALEGVPVVHKPRLVAELPERLSAAFAAHRRLADAL